MTKLKEQQRIVFLDNIRGFAILALVVLFHPAVPYSIKVAPHLNFYLIEPSSIIYDLIALFFDTFLMPLLFLVAGYFALPSLLKRTSWQYIRVDILFSLKEEDS